MAFSASMGKNPSSVFFVECSVHFVLVSLPRILVLLTILGPCLLIVSLPNLVTAGFIVANILCTNFYQLFPLSLALCTSRWKEFAKAFCKKCNMFETQMLGLKIFFVSSILSKLGNFILNLLCSIVKEIGICCFEIEINT